MYTIETLERKLQNRFKPSRLVIINESNDHKGHQGFKEGIVTHIKIQIEAEELKGKSLVASHKLIYEAINQEMQSGLHAIAIEVIR
jgi:BolA protein